MINICDGLEPICLIRDCCPPHTKDSQVNEYKWSCTVDHTTAANICCYVRAPCMARRVPQLLKFQKCRRISSSLLCRKISDVVPDSELSRYLLSSVPSNHYLKSTLKFFNKAEEACCTSNTRGMSSRPLLALASIVLCILQLSGTRKRNAILLLTLLLCL